MSGEEGTFDWTPSNDALARAIENLRDQVAELEDRVEELEDDG